MPLKVWNGSSWEVQAQIRVWNGSSWVALNEIDNAKTARVWNGSSWVQFHPGVQLVSESFNPGGIYLYDQDLTFSPISASATVSITLNSNGTATYARLGSLQTYSWLLTGSNSDYYAYMDAPTGSSFNVGSSATNTSLQLNTTRSWSLSVGRAGGSPGSNTKALTSTLLIQNSAGTDIISIFVDMEVLAEVQP